MAEEQRRAARSTSASAGLPRRWPGSGKGVGGAAHQEQGAHRAGAEAAWRSGASRGRRSPTCRLAAAPRLGADGARGRAGSRSASASATVLDDVDFIAPARRARRASSGRTASGKTTLPARAARRAPARRGRGGDRASARGSPTTTSSARSSIRSRPSTRRRRRPGRRRGLHRARRPAGRAARLPRRPALPRPDAADAGEGALRRRAQPAAAGAAVPARARTCWCSTSRPTTSTS